MGSGCQWMTGAWFVNFCIFIVLINFNSTGDSLFLRLLGLSPGLGGESQCPKNPKTSDTVAGKNRFSESYKAGNPNLPQPCPCSPLVRRRGNLLYQHKGLHDEGFKFQLGFAIPKA